MGQHSCVCGAIDVAQVGATQAGGTARPLAQPCPMDTTCAACGRRLRRGWPVRPTPDGDDTTLPWMHCACWWARQP